MFSVFLVGDEVHIKFEGDFFGSYLAIMKSLGFPRFSGKTRTWYFPISLFHRLSKTFTAFPETPSLTRELYDRLIADRKSREQAVAVRELLDVEFEPLGFRGELFAFQRVGSRFLVDGRRVVLCDDVGLGKTVVAVASLAHLFDANEIDSALIIVPGHIKRQWASEVERFTFHRPVMIEGSRRKREQQLREDSQIVITNYELLGHDPEYLERDWGVVIVDEVQTIKNFWTKASKLARKLKATYKWGLTATAIENNLPELFSILEFVCPGFLGRWQEFDQNYIVRNRFGAIKHYRNLERLREIIRPFILRRRVEHCFSDFPRKDTRLLRVEFTDEQFALYNDVLERVLSMEDEWRANQINTAQKMNQIGFLRQACDHPALIGSEMDICSNKITRLKELQEEVHGLGEKMVVFTEWERMARIIARELGGCPMLSGKLSYPSRHEKLKRWAETDEPLVTTDCSNVGLNLQQANWVVSYEMHWNPAVMRQRTGRVWRLTQERPVHARALVVNGSVEEHVFKALVGKFDLFKNVIDALASHAKKERRNVGEPR